MDALEFRPTVAALSEALDESQFFLVYQPVFDLRTERMNGAEALLRWRHPVWGTIPPDRFLPLAEESGLIVPIGRWVLRTACEQAAEWRERRDIGIGINLSARQLADPRLPAVLGSTLTLTGLDPACVTLEIAETALMRDPLRSARATRQLKGLGVRIAIDDFGAGRCSLAELASFPIDAIKIDRCLLTDSAARGDGMLLVRIVVKLGKLLGLETLGEGIEEESQLRALQDLDLDSGQGFHLAAPVDPQLIAALLDDDVELTAARAVRALAG
jgi:EAL domain-containing protein (putative c-di-GMP-specific phosphodiesterase class I)